MIRAVIFDCFGVLTTDGWLPFKDRHFGHDAHMVQQATDFNKQADAGLTSYNDFVQSVATLADIPLAQAYKEIEDNVANAQLFAYITKLKDSYKIGMLSNAADNWVEELFSAEQRSLFNALALSYETGFIKPDPRAYGVIAERLGVSLDECIFVDDQERYCVAAQEAGMQVVNFVSTEQAIVDINRLLQQSKA